jgi:hypothetical protein
LPQRLQLWLWLEQAVSQWRCFFASRACAEIHSDAGIALAIPVSVQAGAASTTAPRYYYVYDARGDVVASYSYDT